MNLEISYRYRDAANNKNLESVVISVPDRVTPKHVEDALRQYFAADQSWSDILHFRPEDLGWPTAYFEDHDVNKDDLDLHELEIITITKESATTAIPLNLQLTASQRQPWTETPATIVPALPSVISK